MTGNDDECAPRVRFFGEYKRVQLRGRIQVGKWSRISTSND